MKKYVIASGLTEKSERNIENLGVSIIGFHKNNSVAAPAIEYKKEGQVFGIGCKIFTIAGPVILYGIFTSWVLGLIYWIWGMVA